MGKYGRKNGSKNCCDCAYQDPTGPEPAAAAWTKAAPTGPDTQGSLDFALSLHSKLTHHNVKII